ncbi:MAG: hypothetical protein K6E75_13990 [Lachnospiraceae bacterium]|nr:hypothetical protein [Lachnospiraceae bacterium]
MRKKFYYMLAGGIFSSIIVSLVLVSDAVVAGILIGDTAVAGMNLVAPVYSFAAALSMLFSIGTPILYSEAIGDFEKERANAVFRTGLTASMGCGIVLFLAFLIVGEHYLSTIRATEEILESARKYMFWIRLDIIFLPISVFLPGMIFADGDEVLGSISDIAGSVSNILLSVILGRRMGVTGIGIGSLVGTIISLAICSMHFLKKRNSLKPGLYMSGKLIGSISLYSIVDASGYLFLAAFVALMNRYLSSHFGPDMLILSSILTFVIEMQFLLDGIGGAMTPAMSIYLTMGSCEGVMKIWKEAKRAAVIVGLLCALAMAVSAPFIPKILGISDQSVAHLAAAGIRILAVSMPFIALLYLLTSYNVLTKKIAFGVMITALYELIFAVLFAVILGNIAGIYGVFAGVCISPAITWFVVKCYVIWKEGKDAWPLRLAGRIKPSFLFDFVVELGSITDTREKLEGLLRSEGIPSAAVVRCIFLFEEVFMEIYDKNGQNKVSGECIITLTEDSIRLIEIDDGIIFKMGDEVEGLSSLREYVLSQAFINWSRSLEYLKAISFNRNRLEISLKEDGE